MVTFDYRINDEMGLHARPVGLVVKAVSPYKNTMVRIRFGEKTADAKRMFAVLGLQVKKGDEIAIEVEGENEKEIVENIRGIFATENL